MGIERDSSKVPKTISRKQSVATYSKGLKTRVSNDKALKQMGYKCWNDWKDSQMACLENLVREKGYDREYMNNTNKHEPDVQKFIQSEKKLIAEANKRIQNIETIPDTLPTRTAKTTSGELVHIFSQQEYKYSLSKATLNLT